MISTLKIQTETAEELDIAYKQIALIAKAEGAPDYFSLVHVGYLSYRWNCDIFRNVRADQIENYVKVDFERFHPQARYST